MHKHICYFQKLHYPEWHEEINAIDKDFITRRTLKALWYAYQIEKMEADQETATAKALRKKFFNESTQRKEQKFVTYIIIYTAL